MIDTKAIRSKILDLAMRGLLIEQNSRDGTGHSLIEENFKIINKSDESIKKRFGKGCKPLKQEDYLFDIPEKWCWERFGNLVINYDSQRKPVTKSERKRLIGQYDYYGATGAIDRVDDFIFDGEYLMIGEDGGNFYVSRDNSFIARGKFWANNHVHVVKPVACDITYLKHCLDAYDLPKMGLVYGIGAPKLNQENMNSIPIPVPPLAEQKRIVEKIKQTFSVLDTIDELQAKYADNLTVLKSKLIDLAIRGKLTEQLPEDGTAAELYQQIQEEKQALIKSGKIKKEKPLPEIAETEIPFEIPENWKWVRLGEFGSWHAGATPARGNSAYYNGSIPWLKTGDLNDNFISSVPEYITELALKECSVQLNPVGSVLIAMYGATIGKLGIAKIPLTTNQACCACIPHNGIYNRFLFFLLMSMRKTFIGMGIGGAQSNISREKIVNTVVPFPPLAEQKRIVDRLDKLLAVCDEIK